MRFARTCALSAALSVLALPVFAQTAPTSPDANSEAAKAVGASIDYAALRDNLSNQNKSLTGDVTTQRAILKKNQDLLKEAQKLDASNKKMQAEKQRMIQQNAELEKQRAALVQAQGQTSSQESSAPSGATIAAK